MQFSKFIMNSSIQGFIRHMLYYTEYNRSMDSAKYCNTTQENIHKYK